MKTLFILNDPPYGTERSYRLAAGRRESGISAIMLRYKLQ